MENEFKDCAFEKVEREPREKVLRGRKRPLMSFRPRVHDNIHREWKILKLKDPKPSPLYIRRLMRKRMKFSKDLEYALCKTLLCVTDR